MDKYLQPKLINPVYDVFEDLLKQHELIRRNLSSILLLCLCSSDIIVFLLLWWDDHSECCHALHAAALVNPGHASTQLKWNASSHFIGH